MKRSVIDEIFAKDVFNDAVMRERLPKPIYKQLREIIDRDLELDASIANAVAHAMKEWALERGAMRFLSLIICACNSAASFKVILSNFIHKA